MCAGDTEDDGGDLACEDSMVASMLPSLTVAVDFDPADYNSQTLEKIHQLQATIAVTIISLIGSAIAAVSAALKRKNLTLGLSISSAIFSLVGVAVYGALFAQVKADVGAYSTDDFITDGVSLNLAAGFYLLLVALILRLHRHCIARASLSQNCSCCPGLEDPRSNLGVPDLPVDH